MRLKDQHQLLVAAAAVARVPVWAAVVAAVETLAAAMDSSDPADCCPKDWQRFYLGAELVWYAWHMLQQALLYCMAFELQQQHASPSVHNSWRSC